MYFLLLGIKRNRFYISLMNMFYISFQRHVDPRYELQRPLSMIMFHSSK